MADLTVPILCFLGALLCLIFWLKPQPALAKDQSSTPTPARPSDYYYTFRISDVPRNVSKDGLREALEQLVFSNHAGRNDGGNVIGMSLAASSSEAERRQIATVTFRQIPDILGPCARSSRVVFERLSIAGNSDEVSFDSRFLGLTPLNSCEKPQVDIVAVTGLGGHAYGSWKARGGVKMWLRDFFAQDLHEDDYSTRMLTYGYDSTLIGSDSDASIHEFARRFLEELKNSRRRPDEIHRPIIFIAHSLGGIVLKHALTEARQGDDKDKAIFSSCYAALLFGVPNKGLHITHLISMVEDQPNRRLVEDLGEKSQFLPHLHREFYRQFDFKDARIYSFYETKDTELIRYDKKTKRCERTGTRVRMVTRDSATYSGPNERIYHQLNIDEDHSNIVKFGDRNNTDYTTVRGKIRECLDEAPKVIRMRFPDQRQKTDLEKNCLRSLLPTSNDPTAKAPSAKIHHGTCKWILEQDTFKNWRSSEENASKFLWIRGSPGTGKTVLMNFLRVNLAQDPGATVIYFFCNDKDKESRTAVAILTSLVHQLLDQNPGFFQRILPEYEKFDLGREKKWSASAIWRIFRAIMTDPAARSVHCVIDAMDECLDNQQEGNEYSRSNLLDDLRDLYLSQAAPTCAGRIAISSRLITDIEMCFDNVRLTIRLEDFNGNDIRKFISDEVGKLAKKINYSAELKAEVEDILEEKSGNMFLWVCLTINELGKRYTPTGIRELLNDAPRTLFAYYEHMLATIAPHDVERARKILMWIAHSSFPISLEEMTVAMAAKEDTRSMSQIQDDASLSIDVEIKDLCGPLIEIVDSQIVLIHQTVKDFLMKDSESVGNYDVPPFEPVHHRKYHVPLQEAESNLARICITYLTFADHLESPDLLVYFVSALPFHARQSGPLDQRTKNMFRAFFKVGSVHFGLWVKCYWSMHEDPRHEIERNIQPLYIASYLHIVPVVQLLVEDGADVNNQGGRYGNALQCAASGGGNLEAVKFLVENGARVNARGGYFGTPVTAAASSGNIDIVKYLLENGADVNIKEGHFGCSLQAAAWYGHINTVRLLLEHGADMHLFCGEFGNPLLGAAWSGHLDIVELLLDRGMHPDTRGPRNGFPLQAAIRRKQVHVIERLLERGANVNLQGGVHGSALHAAVFGDTADLVQRLIEKGADVSCLDVKKGTPLHIAAGKSRMAIVRLLVDAGINIIAKNAQGKTAEELAIENGHMKMARFLRKSRAEGSRVKDGD